MRNWLGTEDADAVWSNEGLEVRAAEPTYESYYKQLASSRNTGCCYPRLSIVHNARPAVPTLLSPPEPTAWVTTRNPTFRARYSDPDTTGQGRVEFEIDGDARGWDGDSAASNPGEVTWSPTWQDLSTTPPTNTLARDGQFRWQARASDGDLTSAASAWRGLQVDTQRPDPVVGFDFVSDHAVGETSQTTKVSAFWNPAADPAASNGDRGSGIAGYSFDFNTSETMAAPKVKDPSVADRQADEVLPRGTYWLHVRAVDVAGWWSEDAVYGPFSINQAPQVPTLRSPEDGVTVGNRRPTLVASYKDPDSDPGAVEFQILDEAGKALDANPATAEVDWHRSPVAGSGRDVTETWPQDLEDGKYSWRARADDQQLRSAPSTTQTFFVGVDGAPVIEKYVAAREDSAVDGLPEVTVGQGEAVRFRIRVSNPTTAPIKLASLVDELPPGLRVAPGSVVIDGIDVSMRARLAASTQVDDDLLLKRSRSRTSSASS